MTFDRRGRGPRMLGMMGIVLGSALGFAAIRTPTQFAGQAVATATVAALIVGWLGAILCEPKAFWFGFAAVGSASFLAGWINSPEPTWSRPAHSLVLPVEIYRRLDEDSYLKTVARCEHGLLTFKRIVHPLAALAMGMLGGLVAMGATYRSRSGKSMGDLLGRRLSVAVCLAMVLGPALAALRFPDSMWGTAPILGTYTLLVAVTLRAFLAPPRSAWLAAAIVGWSLVLAIVIFHASGIFEPTLMPIPDPAAVAYTSLYPEVLAPGWSLEYSPVGPPSWRSVVLGGPVGSIMRPLPSWVRPRPRYPYWEGAHYRCWCLVFDHLLALAAAAVVGLIVARVTSKWRSETT